jgi:hypothetical protein
VASEAGLELPVEQFAGAWGRALVAHILARNGHVKRVWFQSVMELLPRGRRMSFGKGGWGEKQALGAADKRIVPFVKAKKLIGGPGDADADRLADGAGGAIADAEPEWSGGAEIEAVVPAIDLQRRGKTPGAAREIEEPGRFAVALHEFDALERFERADQDRRGNPGRLAHDVQHEVRSVIEKNVGVPGMKIHGTNARSRTTVVMAGGIAWWIGFGFDDSSAQAAGRKIVNDDFADEKVREFNRVVREFAAAETADRKFRRSKFGFAARCRHKHRESDAGFPIHRDFAVVLRLFGFPRALPRRTAQVYQGFRGKFTGRRRRAARC